MNVLVVDWDFFFPVTYPGDEPGSPDWQLWDWGHDETRHAGLFLDFIWYSRAAGFIRAGRALPSMDGTQRDFWRRFRFTKHASLYVAESNALAADRRVLDGATSVWLYDAHHDSGYQGENSLGAVHQRRGYICEDWMLAYWARGAETHMRYPQHRVNAFEREPHPWLEHRGLDRKFDDGQPNPVLFSRVFLCRSGVWVPSWCDRDFEEFVETCPVRRKVGIPDGFPADRNFKIDEAHTMARLIDEQIARLHDEQAS